MSEKSVDADDSDQKYLQFVVERVRTSDYHAEEKLRRIDELAEVIFAAKKNMRDDNKQ